MNTLSLTGGSAALLMSLLMVAPTTAQSKAPRDSFSLMNGVHLHYVDWGGRGQALLFLTSFDATAHEFDGLARILPTASECWA